MRFKDHFSKQAAGYAKFRPRCPQILFDYLGAIAPRRHVAWDCATGNGQAAIGLARFAPAENSGIGSETVDLIMVAQPSHWFDLDGFYAEARRVLKNNGVVAAAAYNLLNVKPAIDLVVNRYYYKVVGPFWPPERKLVEQFADLPFPFSEIDSPKFEMTAQWNLDHLLGYLQTWSSTQRFIAAHASNPLEQIIDELRAAWGDSQQAGNVTWSLVLRIGIKSSAE